MQRDSIFKKKPFDTRTCRRNIDGVEGDPARKHRQCPVIMDKLEFLLYLARGFLCRYHGHQSVSGLACHLQFAEKQENDLRNTQRKHAGFRPVPALLDGRPVVRMMQLL
jgi:hypothetical protein